MTVGICLVLVAVTMTLFNPGGGSSLVATAPSKLVVRRPDGGPVRTQSCLGGACSSSPQSTMRLHPDEVE